MTQVIADYTGFDYKQQFWDGKNREYEDICDRLAIRKLLPKKGAKIVDICGGYGRLIPEYLVKFSEVHLFDYAINLLDQANAEYKEKVKTTCGSVYELPYPKDFFDVCVMVRATHHLADFEKVIKNVNAVLKTNGVFIIEVANKRNVLEIVRWLLGKSKMEPFDLKTTSRNDKGFFNYHPKYVENVFKANGFLIKKVLSVSNFRNNLLKKVFGVKLLVTLENWLQKPLGLFKVSPSTYYLLEKVHA